MDPGRVIEEVLRWVRLDRGDRSRRRSARVSALEASDENPAFAPSEITQAVRRVIAIAERVWGEDPSPVVEDRDRVVVRWAELRRRGVTRAASRPRVDLFRVVHRGSEGESQVWLRVRLRLRHALVPGFWDDRRTLDEEWVLTLRDGEWSLISADRFPRHAARRRPSVASAGDDLDRLRFTSLDELTTDPRQEVSSAGGLTDDGRPPDYQLGDLALVDDRFSPVLIEAVLGRSLNAWEQAVLSKTGHVAFQGMAHTTVIRDLILPETSWPQTFLSVSHPRLDSWKALAVGAADTPAWIEVQLTVSAVHHLGRRRGNTDPTRHGDPVRPQPMTLRWTLTADPTIEGRWRLTGSSNPAAHLT